MAHPSPSPSGSCGRRRRLSEVLGEQQEPFSLDLYLLERGCSPAFLDATACGGGACSTCWPGTGATGRTLRRPPARNTKGSRRRGVLRTLLTKILSGATAAPAPAKQNRKVRKQRTAAIGWRRVVAEKQRTPADRLELALRSASPGAGPAEAHAEDDGEQGDDGDDEDESSKKQLSPVSVLEQRLFEPHSPPPPHAPNDLAIFGDLLEAAYAPNNALLNDVLAIAREGRSNTDSSTPATTTTPRARRRRRKKKKHDARRKEEIGRLSRLVVSEMAGAGGVRAVDLRPWVEDVGELIAAAVLEALMEETAAELMGWAARDCAADTTTRWC